MIVLNSYVTYGLRHKNDHLGLI